MQWFVMALKRFADFSGRSRRSEYWYFTLFYLLISLALMLVDAATGTLDPDAGVGLLSGIFFLIILVPLVAVTVRRLHDTDRSGWWMLVGMIPLIGGLVLIYFCVQDSTAGDNRFGRNPKALA